MTKASKRNSKTKPAKPMTPQQYRAWIVCNGMCRAGVMCSTAKVAGTCLLQRARAES